MIAKSRSRNREAAYQSLVAGKFAYVLCGEQSNAHRQHSSALAYLSDPLAGRSGCASFEDFMSMTEDIELVDFTLSE